MGRVLIVEDDSIIAEYFKVVVEGFGYDVCGIAPTAQDAVRLAEAEDPAIIFMDVRLKGEKDGVDAANAINSRKSIPTVYITGSGEDETIERIHTNHPSAILIKPILAEQIGSALSRFCPQN